MKSILSIMNNPKAFSSKLIELANQKRSDGTTRVRIFFEQLTYHIEDIPEETIPLVILILFDIGDQLLKQESNLNEILDFRYVIIFITHQLLKRVDKAKRYEILKNAIKNGRSITIIMSEIRYLDSQCRNSEQSSMSNEEKLIEKHHPQELKKIILEKIRNAAKK